MHRKRVTCELHDSYFRLMTIKHAIPKILSGRLHYYITRWEQEVSELEIREVRDKMWKRKPPPGQKGPLGPPIEFGDPLVTRCGRESQHSAGSWAPGPPVEQPWRTRKTQRWWAIRVGVSILQFCSVSNSLSHTTLSNKVRGIFF